MNLPIQITLEKRTEDVPRWLPVATSVGSVVLAFLVVSLGIFPNPVLAIINRLIGGT